MNINYEAAETLEKILKENNGVPENWIWVCVRYIYFYLGNVKDIKDLANDVVMGIITKVIMGKRNWDSKSVPFEKFIYNTIWSEVSHLYEKRKRIAENESYNNKTNAKTDLFEDTGDATKEEIELLIDNDDLIKRCYEEIKHDTDMGIVFELMLEGKTPKEMELEYGITTDEVDAIKKRMYRLLRKKYNNEYSF